MRIKNYVIDDLTAARLQWKELAALAEETSKSDNRRMHSEALQLQELAAARIEQYINSTAQWN